MISREGAWEKYVRTYEIEVPEEKVNVETEFIITDLRHRMQYASMAGGEFMMDPMARIQEQMDEIRETALFEVKSDLVKKDMIEKMGITATGEELERAAIEMAKRKNTTVEMIRKFFGEDLALLERDVKERKAVDFAVAEIMKEE